MLNLIFFYGHFNLTEDSLNLNANKYCIVFIFSNHKAKLKEAVLTALLLIAKSRQTDQI